ncbi:hypothetical protein D3C87_2187120 [compost metagenome]
MRLSARNTALDGTAMPLNDAAGSFAVTNISAFRRRSGLGTFSRTLILRAVGST